MIKTLLKNLKDLYSTRSVIVHGGDGFAHKYEIDKLHNYVVKLICALIVDYWSQFETVSNLHKEITSVKFGKPILQKNISKEEFDKLNSESDTDKKEKNEKTNQ